MSDEANVPSESFGRQHVAAAVAAACLSLALHGLLIWWLPRLAVESRLRPDALRREREEARRDPVQLFDVQRDPLAGRLDTGGLEPEAPAGRVEDMDAALERLMPALDESGIEALPPDEAWLAQGDERRHVPEPPAASPWQPRQEIVSIEREVVRDEVAHRPRHRVTRIERVPAAPDFSAPFDRTLPDAHGVPEGPEEAEALPRAHIGPPDLVPLAAPQPGAPVRGDDAAGEDVRDLTEETREDTAPYQPIEELLQARLYTFSPFFGREHVYFKIEVDRLGEDVLPVVPKDIVLIQDCSASMLEQVMVFCKKGLTGSLDFLGPDDRFNIVTLRHDVDWLFDGWAENTAQNMEKARAYVAGMKAEGGTDIYQAMHSLLDKERIEGRPFIALLVSDGHPTEGRTDSTDIIGEFTRANQGRIALYTLGVFQTANAYLLDLLSYSNRGESRVVTRGRWAIPEVMMEMVEGVSRPVLSDVRLLFSGDAGTQIYPELTTHLYQDQPLTLYGRAPADADRLVFQAVGQAAGVECDMIFSLSLSEDGERGRREIRESWAKQKIYSMLARYARTRDPQALKRLRATARAYRISVPYEGR